LSEFGSGRHTLVSEGKSLAPFARFWGVRGSVPVPGPDTVIYGGNTTCIEIDLPTLRSGHTLIVDAGTGLRALGRCRDWHGAERIDLLLTHLHHDHVLALPFFTPMFVKGLTIDIWCGNLGGETAEAALACMFSPPLFPLPLTAFPARIGFRGFRAGDTIQPGGVPVRTVPLEHPSGATGYRFDAPGGSLAVITDIEHRESGPDPAVTALCRGVDTLVYDSMLEECDYGRCRGWGHSTVRAGVALGRAAGARRLVGCHHAPEHDDAAMAERERRLQAEWPGSMMAREGLGLACGPDADQAATAAGRSSVSAASESHTTR
jgi:phosphoribosyl 1,2-cyclic phosphodiesterase